MASAGVAVVLAWGLGLSAPRPGLACGWAGDGELRGIEREAVVVGVTPVSPEEATVIGNRFRAGVGGAPDPARALHWYRSAAEQGHAPAQNNLAAMYEHGLGVDRDDAEAAKWYRRAAEQGEPRAQHSLGLLLRDGRGVARDPAEAAAWIRRSAEQGHWRAFADLAELYWRGEGVPRDAVRAAVWLSRAAEHGDETSAARLEAARASMTPDQRRQAKALAAGRVQLGE